jgi:hypothetical protein
MEKWTAVLLIVLVILLDILCLYNSFLTNNILEISWGFMTYSSLVIFNVVGILFGNIFYQVYKENKRYKSWKEKEDYR